LQEKANPVAQESDSVRSTWKPYAYAGRFRAAQVRWHETRSVSDGV